MLFAMLLKLKGYSKQKCKKKSIKCKYTGPLTHQKHVKTPVDESMAF